MDRVEPTSGDATNHLSPRELDGIGDHHLTTGKYGDALRAYQKSLELRRIRGGLSVEHRVSHAFRVGHLYLKLGRYEQAKGRCEEAISLLGEEHPQQRARLVALAGLIECSSGSFEAARQNVEQGLELLQGTDQGIRRWRIEGALKRTEGNLAIGLGEASKAVSAYRRSLELLERVVGSAEATEDDRWQHSIALFNLAEAFTFSGDYVAAMPLLDQAWQAKATLDDRWGLAYIHLARARIHLDRRRPEEARRDAEEGLEHAVAVHDPKIATRLRALVGFCHLRQNQLAEAERSFSGALLHVQEVGNAPELALVKIGLAAVSRLEEKLQTAERHLDSAEAVAKQNGDAEVSFLLDLERGRVALAQGNTEQARTCFERAQAWSQQVGNAFRTMEVLGEMSNLG